MGDFFRAGVFFYHGRSVACKLFWLEIFAVRSGSDFLKTD
jgi:hypothetical protein